MCRIIESVDDALHLSENYSVHVPDLGHAHVLFFASIIIGLIDCTMDDWGLHMSAMERLSGPFGALESVSMDIDTSESLPVIKNERREIMRRANPLRAIDVLCHLTGNKQAMVLLRLVNLNMWVTYLLSFDFNFILLKFYIFTLRALHLVIEFIFTGVPIIFQSNISDTKLS